MDDKKEKTKENEIVPLGAVDAVLAVFYIIIILVGIDLCRTRGLGASNAHLAAVTLSTLAIAVLKIFKYTDARRKDKKNVKGALTDIIFSSAVFLLAAAAFVTTVIM